MFPSKGNIGIDASRETMGNSKSIAKNNPRQSTNDERALVCSRRDSERTGTVTKTDKSCASKHSSSREAGHGQNHQQSVNLVPNPRIHGEDIPSIPSCSHQLEPGSSFPQNIDRPNVKGDVEGYRRNPDHTKLLTKCGISRHEASSTQSPPSGSQIVGSEPSGVFSEKPVHSHRISMPQTNICEHPLSHFSEKRAALVTTSSISRGISNTKDSHDNDSYNPKHLTKPPVDKCKPLLSYHPNNSSASTTSAPFINVTPSPRGPDLGRSTNEWQPTAFGDSASVTSGLNTPPCQGNGHSGTDASSSMTLFGIEQLSRRYEDEVSQKLNRGYLVSTHTGNCASKTSGSCFNNSSNKESSLSNDDVVDAEASTLGAASVEKCNVLELPHPEAHQIKHQASPVSLTEASGGTSHAQRSHQIKHRASPFSFREASGYTSPAPRNDGTEPDDVYCKTEEWRHEPAETYAFQMSDSSARTDFVVTSTSLVNDLLATRCVEHTQSADVAKASSMKSRPGKCYLTDSNSKYDNGVLGTVQSPPHLVNDDPGDESTVTKILPDSLGSVASSGFHTSSAYDRKDASLATHDEPKNSRTCDDGKLLQRKTRQQLTLNNSTTFMNPSTAQHVISRTEGVDGNRKGISNSGICTQPQFDEEELASGEVLLAESAGSCSSDEERCSGEDLSQPESGDDMHQTRPDNALDDGASTTSESDLDSCDAYSLHETRKSNHENSWPSTQPSSAQFTNDLSRSSEGLCEMPIECINITSCSGENISSNNTDMCDPDGGENRRVEPLLNHQSHISHNFSMLSQKIEVLSAGNTGRGKQNCLDPYGDNAHGSKFGRPTRKESPHDVRTSVHNNCATATISKSNKGKDASDKSEGTGTTKRRRRATSLPSDDNAAGKVLSNTCHEQSGGKPKKRPRNRPSSYKKKQKAKDIKGLSEQFPGPRIPSASSTSQFGRPSQNSTAAHNVKHSNLAKGKISGCQTDSPDVGACRVKVKGTISQPCSDIPSREGEDPKRRGAEALRKHQEKIEEVHAWLTKSKPKKKGKKPTYQNFDDHERRRLEEQVLEQRKSELEDQGREFQNAFVDYISALSSGQCLPKKDLQKLHSNFERECHRLENALPIYGRKTVIVEQVRQSQVSIVLGETGSGKSTQMVQYLYEAGFAATGIIACTQPRKVAASSLSAHVGKEMGSKQLVGCHVGAQCHKNTGAKIMYTTDHALLNECLKDRSLSRYSCIIIDEAHERSIYTDLLLGMVKRALEMRPELRVIITSATISPELFVNYFNGCPVLRVSGRMFPVDVVYSEQSKKDYLLDAVHKAYKIHTEKEQGDVLVFLTSPAEVEQACEKLKDKHRSEDLECLPLHGKLRQEDQKKVFESYPGKRKVIFATNCAETSITVTGVKYVVDCGKVKEMKFDPKRNMSSLVVTNVNQSSAEQRKGRAGRTQAGTCYRLYSQQEYEAMNERSAPEILRIHLGQAILKLMELGVEDPADFDFVESPPKDSLQSATETLKSLGAMSNGRLTQLGRKMARMPLEPRLARLVFQGIDQGVGAEALILAAVATVNGSIFFRMGSDEEKKLADRRKVQFCQENGDLLTLLAAYRVWIAIKGTKRNTWCYENSLNAKALRIAEDTVKELKLVLKHELKVEVKDASAEHDTSSRDETLRKILLSCYISNLCMFSGHERVGYRVVTLGHCIQLHPSSALKVLNFNPRFAVYGQVLKTSREFLLNVTPIEEEWLEESVQKSGLVIDLEKLKASILQPDMFTCSTELMHASLLRRGFKALKHIEEELTRETHADMPVILEVDKKAACVTSFAQASCRLDVRAQVEKRLEEGRQELRREAKELPVLEGCISARALLGSGGLVQRLLMPNIHRSVVSRNVPSEIPLPCVLDALKAYGTVVEHRIFDDDRKVIVTYKNPDAVALLLGVKEGFPFNVDVYQTEQNDSRLWNCGLKVKLTWCRRPAKGTAQVSFKYHDDDIEEVLCSLHGTRPAIKCSPVNFKQDKFYPARLFLWNLGPDVTDRDVELAFQSACPDVIVDKVFIHRQKEFQTSPNDLHELKTTLEGAVSGYLARGKFQIHVQPPRTTKAHTYVANLTIQDAEYGREALEDLQMVGLSTTVTGKVIVAPQLHCTLRCPKDIHTSIKDNVEEIVTGCINDCQTRCGNKALRVNKRFNGNQVVLTVTSECMKHYVYVTGAIRNELDGDVIDCSGESGLDVLLSSGSREALRRVQENTGALIYSDHRSMSIKIYGKTEDKDAAKREINSFVGELFATDSRMWEIHLRAANRPRGLLKAVVSRYGVDLLGLQGLEGVQSVSLDLRCQVLRIKSSKGGYDDVERSVLKCAEALPMETSISADRPDEVECVVCSCPVESDVYRLACCGHAYCLECAQMQVKAKVFPLQCASDGCEELFAWKDIQNVSQQDQKEKRSFVEASIDHYVTSNPDKVKPCLTPDCGAVYAVSVDGKPFICYGCQVELCTSCHVQYHQGLSCAVYQSEKRDGGNVEKYLKEHENTKRCPKCRVLIEKIHGCNHMTCTCGAHMCWRCLKLFPTGVEVYDHQSKCLF